MLKMSIFALMHTQILLKVICISRGTVATFIIVWCDVSSRFSIQILLKSVHVLLLFY